MNSSGLQEFEIGDEVEVNATHTELGYRFRARVIARGYGTTYRVQHAAEVPSFWSAAYLRKLSILELIAEAANEH